MQLSQIIWTVQNGLFQMVLKLIPLVWDLVLNRKGFVFVWSSNPEGYDCIGGLQGMTVWRMIVISHIR